MSNCLFLFSRNEIAPCGCGMMRSLGTELIKTQAAFPETNAGRPRPARITAVLRGACEITGQGGGGWICP